MEETAFDNDGGGGEKQLPFRDSVAIFSGIIDMKLHTGIILE